MKKVKMLTSIAGPDMSGNAGEVVEMDDVAADRVIGRGFGEEVKGRGAKKVETATDAGDVETVAD